MKTFHTPVHHESPAPVIADPDRTLIATCSDYTCGSANELARELTRVINAHEDLVRCLTAAVNALDLVVRRGYANISLDAFERIAAEGRQALEQANNEE